MKILTYRILPLFVALSLCGCIRTVVPIDVRPAAPAYDGNVQDSGLISIGPKGAIITEHARDRFNALVDLYGKDPYFVPTLEHDFGITSMEGDMGRGPLYLISKESLTDFVLMNKWRRMGKAPVSKK